MNVFLSYATLKNELDGDVAEFHRRLQVELRLHSGNDAALVFQDSANIQLGMNWEERIERALDVADVMVALVSPAYLTSEWCRRELATFDERMRGSGQSERIIPVMWVHTDLAPDDAVACIVARHQWVDWTSLRFEDWSASDKRRAISELAAAIVAGRVCDTSIRTSTDEDLATEQRNSLVALLMDLDEEQLHATADVCGLHDLDAKDRKMLVDAVLAESDSLPAFFGAIRSTLPDRCVEVDLMAGKFGLVTARRCLVDPTLALRLLARISQVDVENDQASHLLSICGAYQQVLFELTIGMSTWVDRTRSAQSQFDLLKRLTHLTPSDVEQLLASLTAEQREALDASLSAAIVDPEVIVLATGTRPLAEQVAYVARLFGLAIALDADIAPADSRTNLASRFAKLMPEGIWSGRLALLSAPH